MRAWSVLILILSYGLGALAESPSTKRSISYGDLPNLVREKNENVLAARLIVNAQERRTGRLIRSFLPNLSGRYGSEEFKAGSNSSKSQDYWKAEASINVYRGGRDKLENDIRRSNARAARVGYSGEFNHELKEARQTFWKFIAIQIQIEDKKEAFEKNEGNIKSARKRSGAGVATAADTIEFELHRTLLNQELKKLQLEQDLMKNRLSVAIGLDEHESIELKAQFPHPDEGEPLVPNLSIQDHLDVKGLNEKATVEKLKQRQAANWWQPRVDLYSTYGLPSLSDDYTRAVAKETEWSAGIRLAIDLGQGLEDHADAYARSSEASSSALRSAHRAREVIAADHELRHDLKLLHELIHDADKDIEKAQRFLKLTESEYARGVKNGPDLLGAFEKFYNFRERRTELYREYHETKVELAALVAKEEP